MSHRILVVDDEPNIVDVISMALRFHGFEVESAGTGADAIAAVGGFKPDLIVLDVMLPDTDGFDVARRLGAERARVPILPDGARRDTLTSKSDRAVTGRLGARRAPVSEGGLGGVITSAQYPAAPPAGAVQRITIAGD